MTKRMIDADALLGWVKQNSECHNISEKLYKPEFVFETFVKVASLNKEINELATPAPETQESIFDAYGWCSDLSKAPRNTDLFLIKKEDKKVVVRCLESLSNGSIISFFSHWKYITNLPKQGE